MKIVVLGRELDYANNRIIKSAQDRGHNALFIPILDCSLSFDSKKYKLFHKNEPFPSCDAVIPRSSNIFTESGHFFLKQLEMMNVPCINNTQSIFIAGNKLRTLQALAPFNLPFPKTGFSISTSNITKTIEEIGGTEQIVKTLWGTWGIGTMLTSAPHTTHSVVEVLQNSNKNPLIQEFIKDSSGKSIRCLVVGNKIVATVTYESSNGDFKSNFSRGGTVSLCTPTEEEKTIALKAAQVLDLDYAGVDMVRSNSGSKILEVNSSSDFKGIEQATGINVADILIQHIENKIKTAESFSTNLQNFKTKIFEAHST